MSPRYRPGDFIPDVRLAELARAVVDRDLGEFTMSIPARLDRDADLVLTEAARRLRERGHETASASATMEQPQCPA